ncbi:MAG: DUF3187 family protein [Deferrisomatales bacterium]|nr:DUF3187 family protein [Deferrisomatales bacterium]
MPAETREGREAALGRPHPPARQLHRVSPYPTRPERGRRVARLLGWALGAAVLGAVPAAASEAFAPLRARNLNPPHLVFLQPSAERPDPQPGGRVELAYATVFVSEHREGRSALLDMEVGRAALVGAARGPWGSTVCLEVPYLWYGGGAFDRVVNGYHAAFGFADGGRSDRPDNTWAYEVRRGSAAYGPEPPASGGVGDAVVSGVHPLVGALPEGVGSALRWSLKLPTGSHRHGFGSGSADGGLGLLGSWRGRVVGVTGNLDLVYLGGTADPALRLGTPWVLSSLVSAGVRLGWLGTASAQLRFATSPYDTGLRPLDRPVVLLAAGLRRQLSPRVWASLGFTEDLAVESSPDFSLLASVEW